MSKEKKKKVPPKKKPTKKQTSNTNKNFFSKLPRAIKIIVAVVIILGIIVFFTPLFGVLDKASNGSMTKIWKVIAQMENIVVPRNNQDVPTGKDVGLPAFSTGDQMVVKHKYYTLRYNEQHEQPEWVAYLLEKKNVHGDNERSNNFREDPAVPTQTASPADYRNSGYDRGHLAPAADFNFSEKGISESFFMSNISPQEPAFNRGIWKGLEMKVRQWAIQKGEIHIVTGPILKQNLKKIGSKNKVSVPKEFYKIILSLKDGEPHAIAFLMPNKRCEGVYEDYVVSIDQVEKMTGIDFFPSLPDDLENYLEKTILKERWFNKSESVSAPVGNLQLLE